MSRPRKVASFFAIATAAAALFVWSTGCASLGLGEPTFEQQYWASRDAYASALDTYTTLAERDNKAVKDCYAQHRGRSLAEKKAACPAQISQDTRNHIDLVTTQATAELLALDKVVAAGGTPTQVELSALATLKRVVLEMQDVNAPLKGVN
jgi:hypothetical protein